MVVPSVLQRQVGQLQDRLVLPDQFVLIFVPLVGEQLVALSLALKLDGASKGTFSWNWLPVMETWVTIRPADIRSQQSPRDHQTASLRSQENLL